MEQPARDLPRTDDYARARRRMVERHIAARGIQDEGVLRAMAAVPRERFLPPELRDRAYADRPLPIGAGQTISQPFIVAYMAAMAEIGPGDRVLEVGTGSGYAAAVFSRIASRVYTVERHAELAAESEERFRELGYGNIEVAVRDGTLGWAEHAPYDAIVVAAGSPDEVPPELRAQLAPGGRLLIPSGPSRTDQDLLRIRRLPDGSAFREENLGPVRFVPLIGAAGWAAERQEWNAEKAAESTVGEARIGDERRRSASRTPSRSIAQRMAGAAEAFDDIEDADLRPLLARIGASRLVLLGEASHGTSEFYRMRARITRALIEEAGFDFVAVEADWPDAAEIDAYVRHEPGDRPHRKPFQRFPRWMWANTDVMAFVRWLRGYNGAGAGAPDAMVGFHGLDLYSMQASIEAVLDYLDDIDPAAAAVARDRYGCLMPWQNDPILYGRAALSGSFDECENEVVRILDDLLARRLDYVRRDGNRFVDAIQNARLVANAEKYYRIMYRGSVASWNLRDQHMFDTLALLLGVYGPGSRGVVWAHNSHLGDASATGMGRRGEHNVGQLVRQAFGGDAWLVGFGTHTGTVAAAREWGAPMEVRRVLPAHPRSYEHICHESAIRRFLLHLRDPSDPALRQALIPERLERAIGVIYRPETELQSHYFEASLPRQFDEWVWFEESEAVRPIGEDHREELEGMPETFPFGL